MQKNKKLQEQFQAEFSMQGQLSMEHFLDSAKVVGLEFSVDELHETIGGEWVQDTRC